MMICPGEKNREHIKEKSGIRLQLMALLEGTKMFPRIGQKKIRLFSNFRKFNYPAKMSQLPTMKVSLLNYVRKMNNYIKLQEIKKPPCPGATRRGVAPTPIRGWESS
ncbi:MAG: hypothetical protein WC342_00470 [Methanoregula sp.]